MKNDLLLFLVGPSNHKLWKDVGHTSFALIELLGKRQGSDYFGCSCWGNSNFWSSERKVGSNFCCNGDEQFSSYINEKQPLGAGDLRPFKILFEAPERSLFHCYGKKIPVIEWNSYRTE